jgi:hypothetical protein
MNCSIENRVTRPIKPSRLRIDLYQDLRASRNTSSHAFQRHFSGNSGASNTRKVDLHPADQRAEGEDPFAR